jgi:hypothetical protein
MQADQPHGMEQDDDPEKEAVFPANGLHQLNTIEN